MTANDYLCLLCSKIVAVIEKEKYGREYCNNDWQEIYRLYTYYISLSTGCDLDDDYICKLGSAFSDFSPTTVTTTTTKSCSISFAEVTASSPGCPSITISEL